MNASPSLVNGRFGTVFPYRSAHSLGARRRHNRNIGICTVRAGQITAVREYTDTQHVEHVLFGGQRGS